MGGENRNHEEQWLDNLLRVRADAEPRAGLEERVLARIASETPRRVLAIWPILAAASALVVIAISLIVLHSETPRQHLADQTPATEKPLKLPEDKPSLRASASNREAQKHRRDSGNVPCCVSAKTVALKQTAKENTLPKLATFPAPQPETEQERMLSYLAGKTRGLNGAGVSTDSADVAQLQDLSVPEFKIHAMEEEPPVNDNPQR